MFIFKSIYVCLYLCRYLFIYVEKTLLHNMFFLNCIYLYILNLFIYVYMYSMKTLKETKVRYFN